VIGVLALGALSRLRAGAGAAVPTLASLSSPTAVALSAGGRPTLPPTWTPTGAPPAPDGQRPADSGQAGSPAGSASPPLLVAPELSLADAQAGVTANPDDEIAHLALFRAQLEAGQTDALVGTLEAGLLVAENRANFLLSAAQTATDMGSNAVAVAILRDGLTRLQSDPSYLLLRSEGGAALYSAALHAGSMDIFDLRDFSDVSTIGRTDVSPIYSAIMARALLTGGNERLAGLTIEMALRRDPRMPEGQLVLGEVKAALGDTEEALTIWQALTAQQQMPPWVRTRLEDLLG
jgi:tetratricopeptide (TPR) repeat protein